MKSKEKKKKKTWEIISGGEFTGRVVFEIFASERLTGWQFDYYPIISRSECFRAGPPETGEILFYLYIKKRFPRYRVKWTI